MNQTLRLPACHRYVRGGNAADKLYTLAAKTAPCHMEGVTEKDFHALLLASSIISTDHPLPKIIGDVSCFSVISEYKCGYICHMCPYAKRNKNAMETEECLLLSYAMKNFGQFQFLKDAGLDSQKFTSLFLLNDHPDGKIVSTLPLLRLSYQYMERVADQKTDFSSLPSMIAGALDQNNKGKLLPQNVQAIQQYLIRLRQNGTHISQDKITDTINRVLHPSVADTAPPKKETTAPSSPVKPQAADKPACISGLLDQPVTEKRSNAQPAAQMSCKAELHTSAVVPKIIRPQDNAETASSVKDEPQKESLYLPATFSPNEAERTGFPFYSIMENTAELQRLEIFLQFNPVIGAEIVEDADTKKQMLLLCASGQFYYVNPEHEQALSLLHLYFSKSTIRRQVCMEPYKLYRFLQTNDIYHKNVYSLRTVYKLLAQIRNSQSVKTPSAMVKELTSKTNRYGYSPYIFTMLQYVKMYEVLSTQPLLETMEAREKLRTLTYIDSLLGISYELRDVAQTEEPLFSMDEKREYQFLYQPEIKMKEGIYSVTFSFSADNPCGSLVTDILCRIAQKDLAKIQGYRLLQYRQDAFTIATSAQHYEQLCEAVTSLATYLAEKQELIPLIIKEDTVK